MAWSDLDAPRPPTAEEQRELARSFVRTFSTNDGAKVLDHLRRTLLDRRVTPGGTFSSEALWHAEGGRYVVDHILLMIRRGEQL